MCEKIYQGFRIFFIIIITDDTVSMPVDFSESSGISFIQLKSPHGACKIYLILKVLNKSGNSFCKISVCFNVDPLPDLDSVLLSKYLLLFVHKTKQTLSICDENFSCITFFICFIDYMFIYLLDHYIFEIVIENVFARIYYFRIFSDNNFIRKK